MEEDGSQLKERGHVQENSVLILVLMEEDGSFYTIMVYTCVRRKVLILVLMEEDGSPE